MENNEFEKYIKKDDAFDTQKLLEGVDLSDVEADIDLEEILAEYGRHSSPPVPESDEVWINEGYVPKPVHASEHGKAGTETLPPEEGPEPPQQPERVPSAEWDPEPQALYEPAGPREEAAEPQQAAVPLEDVMARVVDAVLEEEEARRQVAQPVRRRGLFSRKMRRFEEDTEPLYVPEEEDEPEERTPYVEEEEIDEDDLLPERSSGEATAEYHRRYKKLRKRSMPALLLALAACGYAVVEYSGVAAEYLTPPYGLMVSLGLLGAEILVCFPVLIRAVTELFHRHFTPELLISLFAVVSAVDGVMAWIGEGRGTQLPFCAVAAVALYFTMRGEMLRLRGLRDSCHMDTYDKNPYVVTDVAGGFRKQAVAAVALYFTMRGEMLRLRGLRDSCHMDTYDKNPYVVTDVAGGFRKQSCSDEGFIRMTDRASEQADWYYLLIPVIATATVVFAALAAVNRFDLPNFWWYWSAILGAASSFAFTAAFGTPLGRLARRLQRDGCAVAGYSGAEMMSRKGSMVLTDSDLFPPGTVFMNGMKVYAHDAIQAVSYAASMVGASGAGLRQVFDDLCRSQGGRRYSVEDFSFYEEGGVAGTIRGESVLLGRADFMAQMGVRLPREIKLKTGVFLAVDKDYEEGGVAGTIRGESVLLGRADFMAQMGVRLPREIKLKTGVFLAVDKELVAVFAIKYMASDNVDAALQAILHNGIRPVFAVRDFNITPALLKRKFKINTKKRCLYPELSQRLALSEEEQESNGRAGALLFREGLMPYAETVIGGKRMHGAVRKSCAWALVGSICGTLLAFYLTFVGGFQVLTPAALLAFQLLWAVPSVLINGWVTQY